MQAGFAGAHGHPSQQSTGFGFNAVNAPSIPTTSGNANGDISSFFSQMSTTSQPPTQPFGSSHAHGNIAQGGLAGTAGSTRHPLPAKPPPTLNTSTNDVNSFFSQMGSASRTSAQKSGHSHGTTKAFNPPTAPAAMRTNGFKANPFAQSNAVGGTVLGGFKLATSLPENWYR
jgi:hypothetical protein